MRKIVRTGCHTSLTVARSIVIDAVLAECRSSGLPRPCYFYCSRSAADTARSNPVEILGSLARQLSCLQDHDTLSKASLELYKHGKEHSSPGPSLKQITQLIIDLLAQRSLSYIILDALDECSPDSRRILFDALGEILQQSSSATRLFISSRDDQDIKLELTTEPAIEVKAAQNRDDIGLFIEHEVSKAARRALLYGKADRDLILLITSVLKKGADGMYVLVLYRMLDFY